MRYLKLPLYVFAGAAMLIVAWSAMLLAIVIGAPLLRLWNIAHRARAAHGDDSKPPNRRESELFSVR